jgi:tetratricopeptide (TPR) repeat protein
MALYEDNRSREAAKALQKATELDPKYLKAHFNLGMVLRGQKRLPEAVEAFRKANDLDPTNVAIYIQLGRGLFDLNRLPEAIATFEKAIDVAPRNGRLYSGLGAAQLRQGSFAEGAAAFKKSLDLLPFDPLRPQMQAMLAQCNKMSALEDRLPLVLEGKVHASGPELVELARMCLEYKRRYPTAVQLYEKAFDSKPRPAEDFVLKHCYNAACAAALGGTGHGVEAAKLGQEEKERLQRQARDWLSADLEQQRSRLKEGQPLAISQLIMYLEHWAQDPDLAAVRETKELAKLPTGDKQAWEKLWTSVRQLLKEASSRFTETTLQGGLTAKETSQVHKLKMAAGKTYILDLESSEFDTLLRLEDEKGKLLAENDDISPDNLNSRLTFTPKQDGVYRVVATSFVQRGRGAYTLRIREFGEGK